MILRSRQSALDDSSLGPSFTGRQITSRATLKPSILKATQTQQQALIAQKAREIYGQDAKDLQIEAVMSLIARKNTFALVGTGFGKSRIAELYYRMFGRTERAIILTLNPLDALGDNQVSVSLKCTNDVHTDGFLSGKRSKKKKWWDLARSIWPNYHSQERWLGKLWKGSTCSSIWYANWYWCDLKG